MSLMRCVLFAGRAVPGYSGGRVGLRVLLQCIVHCQPFVARRRCRPRVLLDLLREEITRMAGHGDGKLTFGFLLDEASRCGAPMPE